VSRRHHRARGYRALPLDDQDMDGTIIIDAARVIAFMSPWSPPKESEDEDVAAA
jgi:hypothetical protein